MSVRIQIRRGTALQWALANPTLADGEMGFETDTGKIKIGDGATIWGQLIYAEFGITASSSITALAPIIYDPVTKTLSLQNPLTATGIDGNNF